MEEPRDSVALGPVSLMSQSDTLHRGIEITPPSSPCAPHSTGETEPSQRESDTSPSPIQNPSDQDRYDPNINLQRSTRLHRSSSVLFLVLIYSTITILSWVVTCILTFRPMTAHHYGVWIWNADNDWYGWSPTYLHNRMLQNERWFVAMRTLRAIAAVLTLPVASAVCASAAVIFVQRSTSQSHLSMRKVMVLADRAWADPSSYVKMALSWKRYGSVFLLLAILINILGAVIYPLQEGLLSSKPIKTPVWPQSLFYVADIPDQWNSDITHDDNLVVLLTRKALETISISTRQPELWPEAGVTCDQSKNSQDEITHLYCVEGTTAQGVVGAPGSPHPFVTELPFGFSTGLIQQFIPRINSSAKYEMISASDFPTGCDTLPGAFYVEYTNTTTEECHGAWALEVCMPGDMRNSPWKSSRDRQDFSEELYMNITISGCLGAGLRLGMTASDEDSLFYRLKVDTTAGYFELPNYMNGGLAGHLLDKDPNSICGNGCMGEGVWHPRISYAFT